MEFPPRRTAARDDASACAGDLITEVTVLVERCADEALTVDLACRDLAVVLDGCDDDALTADGRELIAQVATLQSLAAGTARHMPLAS
jgi:hypothetical protein